jgi:hypothetical protein
VADILARASQRPGAHPIIVDITGGTKPMTAGAVLACRNQGLPMQYMQTHFINGRPDPSAQPQAIKVELHESA